MQSILFILVMTISKQYVIKSQVGNVQQNNSDVIFDI